MTLRVPRLLQEPSLTSAEYADIVELNICTVLCIILMVVGVLFLLLCIPLQFLPGISSILANYNSEPLTCVVTRIEHLNRLSACTWSSCSEGCTKNLYKCLKIRVNVLDTPWQGMLEGQLDNQRVIVEDARLFLNHAGCGYPPEVNCTSFAEIYGNESKSIPCYYSAAYPNRAIAHHYQTEEIIKKFASTLMAPTCILLLSLLLYVISLYKQPMFIEHKIYTTFFILIWLGLFHYYVANINEPIGESSGSTDISDDQNYSEDYFDNYDY